MARTWDGVVRGLSRETLDEMGYRFDDTTWTVRQLCLQSHTNFMEIIWKDNKGRRVKNSHVHNLIGDFLDKCRERGIPALVLAPMGVGKATVYETPVKTMHGDVPIGDLAVGDLVVDPDTGGECEVTGVYPQGLRPCFRVTFSDRTSVVCDENHLWSTRTATDKNEDRDYQPRTCAQLLERGLRYANGYRKWFIPVTAPVQYQEKDLPLDPYLLGAYLGDGHWRGAVASVDEAVRVRCGGGPWHSSGRSFSVPGLRAIIRGLGLGGLRAWEKFIPEPFMFGSVAQRTALLEGLIDTDGAKTRAPGAYEYTSTSERLAKDVAELVRSLGGTATMSEPRRTTYTYKGEKKQGRPSWRVNLKVPFALNVLVRKQNGIGNCTKAIEAIEPVVPQETICIRVSSKSHTFCVNDFTVTHNSEQGQGYLLRMLAEDSRLRCGIVTDTTPHAEQRLDLIRRYITSDGDFNRLFPEVRKGDGVDNRTGFRLAMNTTAKDESIEAAGVLSSGTGTRKDFTFFDDCVTAKNAITEPAQRIRVIASYEQTWIGRLVPGSWHFCIATLYHPMDLWHRLMDKVDERGRRAYAVLKIGVSEFFDCYDVEETWPDSHEKYQLPLWEGVWDEDAYKSKYAQLVVDGDAGAWFTGYRNMVIDPEAQPFKPQMFNVRYPIRDRTSYPFITMYADPASSDAQEADHFAVWVAAWDRRLKAMVILDGAYVHRKTLQERIDVFLDLYEKWRPNDVSIEGKHELSFSQRIEEVARERGLDFHLKKVNHTTKKEERIMGLQPLLARGKILANGERFPWLVTEAESYQPLKAKYDDAMDALEGVWDRVRRWMRRQGYANTSIFDQPNIGEGYQTVDTGGIGVKYHFSRPRPEDRPGSLAHRTLFPR